MPANSPFVSRDTPRTMLPMATPKSSAGSALPRKNAQSHSGVQLPLVRFSSETARKIRQKSTSIIAR